VQAAGGRVAVGQSRGPGRSSAPGTGPYRTTALPAIRRATSQSRAGPVVAEELPDHIRAITLTARTGRSRQQDLPGSRASAGAGPRAARRLSRRSRSDQ
jgi:hypothetical protein